MENEDSKSELSLILIPWIRILIRSLADLYLVNESVNIICTASKSTFHKGNVKFILSINQDKVDTTVIKFEKNGDPIIEATLNFVATKERHGTCSF